MRIDIRVCCLAVRSCVLHLFHLCCFLIIIVVCVVASGKNRCTVLTPEGPRQTISETGFDESCGIMLLKPLAFEFFSRCHPPYSTEEVVVLF